MPRTRGELSESNVPLDPVTVCTAGKISVHSGVGTDEDVTVERACFYLCRQSIGAAGVTLETDAGLLRKGRANCLLHYTDEGAGVEGGNTALRERV